MLNLLAAAALTQSGTPQDFRIWGEQTLKTIDRDFALPEKSLFAEEAGGQKPAFDWGVGVLLPAMTEAARFDPDAQTPLKKYLGATRVYWNPAGPVPGYDVLPMPKSTDRYYDDNQWMAIDLVVASAVLKDDAYLKQAEQTFDFIKSGWDDKLGGGVYWRESQKTSKNTCSNAPATVAAIDLFQQTKDGQYLAFAIKDYAWTQSNLRDPSDGLYYDSVNLDGKLGKAKWSYNSGMMLRAAALLYMVTNVEVYAKDARELMAASLQHWIGPDGTFKDDGKFGFLMVGAMLTAKRLVPGVQDPIPALDRALRILHERGRDATGHYGSRWDRTAPSEGYAKPQLIDQAATATAFLQLYQAEAVSKADSLALGGALDLLGRPIAAWR